MIYLLKDEDSNDILEISDWGEITKRASFVENVDLKNKKLHKIIGSYELKDKRTCGIISCHTAHNKGFIVVTEDNIETNIGGDCGFKYFNVNFNDMTQDFLRNLKNEQRKITLIKAFSRLKEWRNKADLLKSGEKNIDWAIKHINDIKNPLVVGRFSSTELKRMASISQTIVTVPRIASKKDAEIQELFDRKYAEAEEQTIDVVIGSIQHIDCLSAQHDLREIFYMSVTKVLKDLANFNPGKMASPAMSTLVLKVNAIDLNLKIAAERLDIARHFLKKENLQPMYDKMNEMDVVSRADLQRFGNYIKGLS